MPSPGQLLVGIVLALTAGCVHGAVRADRSPLLAVRDLGHADALEVRDGRGERTWRVRRPDGLCPDCEWEAAARRWYRGAGAYEVEVSRDGRALATRRFVVRGDEVLVLASAGSIHGVVEAEGVHLERERTERCLAPLSFRLVNDARPELNVLERVGGCLVRIAPEGGHRPDRAACVLLAGYEPPEDARIVQGQSVPASPSPEELMGLELAEPGSRFVFYVPIDEPVREGGLVRETAALITLEVPSCRRPAPQE